MGVKRICDVYYVPALKHNLLSVGQLILKNYDVHFAKEHCIIRDPDGNLLGKVKMTTNKMFPVKFNKDNLSAFSMHIQDKSRLWHLRFGHLSLGSLVHMSKTQMVRGIPSLNDTNQECEACALGKQARNPFPKEEAWRAKCPLELVHTDVCGPMRTPSIGGSKYILSFIDDFSRKTWVYFLHEKSQVFEKFKSFKSFVEKQSGLSLKVLRSDNGGEYTSQQFESFLKEHGIRHQKSTRYTLQQNGVAERKNKAFKELVRSMLKFKSLTDRFWAEVVACAIYVLNRATTRSLQRITPQQAWNGYKPTVAHLRVFGCLAYSRIPAVNRGKLDDRSEKCIFIGYSETSKAYKLYNPITCKVIISRDALFMEEKAWE